MSSNTNLKVICRMLNVVYYIQIRTFDFVRCAENTR